MEDENLVSIEYVDNVEGSGKGSGKLEFEIKR